MRKRIVYIMCMVAMVVVAAWLIARERLVASVGYNLCDTFSVMPADDSGLVAWLYQQPGIVKARFSREGDMLTINFIQVRNLAGRPRIPDLDSAAEALGYQGGHGFRDSQ